MPPCGHGSKNLCRPSALKGETTSDQGRGSSLNSSAGEHFFSREITGENRSMKKIAVLTGGGDCPGLNSVIRSVVLSASGYEIETFGVHNGWRGLADGDLERLTGSSVAGILSRGGTCPRDFPYQPVQTP